MPPLYEFAILGSPTQTQITGLRDTIENMVKEFGLSIGNEVTIQELPASFAPDPKTTSGAVYFGGPNAVPQQVQLVNDIIRQKIPVLPVVDTLSNATAHLPPSLVSLNAMATDTNDITRIATATLECANLLPKRRRVFLSYKRAESRAAAIQLFEELSERYYEVFLDTHGIAPAEDFQAELWHKLCGCDAVVMLDTEHYFDSRWTSAEFGRALAKGIAILRVGWPGVPADARTSITTRIDLKAGDLDAKTNRLTDQALNQICSTLEAVRSKGHAVQRINFISKLNIALGTVGGTISGVGAHKTLTAQLAGGQTVLLYPVVGMPDSLSLHAASVACPSGAAAVVYDHIGLHSDWIGHLDWLGQNVTCVRWVRIAEAAWSFGGWGT